MYVTMVVHLVYFQVFVLGNVEINVPYPNMALLSYVLGGEFYM